MAKPPMIENDVLLNLIDDYFLKECGGRISKMKFPAIAQYVRNNGYPMYQDYLLRRNAVAREHIEKLIANEQKVAVTVSTYRTLDATEFVNQNSTKKKMIASLTALDDYYKEVAESATSIFKDFRKYEDQITSLNQEIRQKDSKIESLEKEIASLKSKVKTISSEKAVYKNVVNKYVYPEIAAKILSDAGIAKLPHEHIVDDPEIITADTELPITSKLLHMFKDEE